MKTELKNAARREELVAAQAEWGRLKRDVELAIQENRRIRAAEVPQADTAAIEREQAIAWFEQRNDVKKNSQVA